MGKIIFASLFLLSCFSLCDVYAQTKTFGDWESGVSSFFSNIDEGSCSFGTISTSSFPYGYTMAPNSAIYRDSDACGGCYEVQCISGVTDGCECRTDSETNKNVIATVMVTQECPACIEDDDSSSSQNEFQLSEAAFNTIASDNCGAINMQYRQVSCDISNNIIIHNTADSGQDLDSYGLYVSNVANYGEISKVEIKDSEDNAAWIVGDKSVNDNSYTFTSSSSFSFKLPFSVRLTDSGGNVLTASDIITTVTANDEFDFGDNFDVTNLITVYQIHIPICISGVGYDNYPTNEAIVEAAEKVFAGYDDNDYDIVDTSVSTGDDGLSFNVTLLVETEVPLPVTRAALNGTLCKGVGPALDSTGGASCSVCDEIITDTVEREESQDEDTHTATNDDNNEDASCSTSVTLMMYLIGIVASIMLAIGL